MDISTIIALKVALGIALTALAAQLLKTEKEFGAYMMGAGIFTFVYFI